MNLIEMREKPSGNITFMAHYVRVTPDSKTISIDRIDGDWRKGGTVEMLTRNGHISSITPFASVAADRQVEELIDCAIAFYHGAFRVVDHWRTPSYGVSTDTVVYKIDWEKRKR